MAGEPHAPAPGPLPGTVDVNGVTLAVEHVGDRSMPTVILVGAPTMLSWSDALCVAVARGGRHVVRYDLRDSGRSTRHDPATPGYTLRDLADDAAALARDLSVYPVHLAGIGVGGMVAQLAALDHPAAFSALTLIGTRAVAPGPVDENLPDHDADVKRRVFSLTPPDWSERESVVAFATARAEILGNDAVAAGEVAGRIWDRTPGSDAGSRQADQLGMAFARLDCAPRWRERLPGLTLPTLVVHGRCDRFFPVGNGEALAHEIPDARLLVLDNAASAIPPSAVGEVAAAMLAL